MRAHTHFLVIAIRHAKSAMADAKKAGLEFEAEVFKERIAELRRKLTVAKKAVSFDHSSYKLAIESLFSAYQAGRLRGRSYIVAKYAGDRGVTRYAVFHMTVWRKLGRNKGEFELVEEIQPATYQD